jgi:rare lipoprotein A
MRPSMPVRGLRAIRRVLIVMATALLISATMGAATEARARHRHAGHSSTVVGTASWYGWRQHGRRMADGQTFHALGSAAASPRLPLGSLVKVTNLANHRVAWVTIQDREPAKRGRVVDVSLGTARALGMEKQGLTQVRLEVSKEHAARGERIRAAPGLGADHVAHLSHRTGRPGRQPLFDAPRVGHSWDNRSAERRTSGSSVRHPI